MIKPYGSDKLVNQMITKDKLKELDLSDAPKLILSPLDLMDCNRIADGSLTPINRFMNQDEMESILNNN